MKTCWSNRGGRANAAVVTFVGSIVALGGLIGALVMMNREDNKGGDATQPLIVFCAAGIKPPVEAAAAQYEKELGVKVQLQFGGSETLLSNIATSKRGDVYIPADQSYLALAREKGLIAESVALARMRPRLGVAKGNPKSVKSLDDLINGDVKFGLANPDAAAIGKLTRAALRDIGKWDVVSKRTSVYKGTVNDIANDIKIGAIDAGFVWDATVRQYPALDGVELPELKFEANIGSAVIKSSNQPAAALKFMRYLAAKDKGLKAFEKAGYTVVEGDVWTERPEINLFAGAMLRPAIEATITKFEEREGCRVNRIYNGCGILVGEMRKGIGAMPDAYISCDASFMTMVKDLFLDSADVSTNQLVILVHKGNPHGIKSIKDMGKPGLRIGVGHEKQCALGALTETTLKEAGMYAAARRNVVVESPTGDLLVNQIRAGSLDAVIAYVSNATNSGDKLEAIGIEIPCAIATQPMAVSKSSANKQITSRLMEAILSAESKERFIASGFQWKGPK